MITANDAEKAPDKLIPINDETHLLGTVFSKGWKIDIPDEIRYLLTI